MVGSEAGLISGAEPMVPLAAVADARYVYVALGHVHRFQEMNARPPVVYCGSLDRVDFGEEGQEKGFVVVDIEQGVGESKAWRASYEFVPTPARRFVTVDVQVESPDGTADIEQAIGAAHIADSVTRVRVTMKEDQALDEDRVRESLRESFLALPIRKEVLEPAAAPRAPGLAERMTDPLAALNEYLTLRQVSEERSRALREKAEALLADLRRDTEPILGTTDNGVTSGRTADGGSRTAQP